MQLVGGMIGRERECVSVAFRRGLFLFALCLNDLARGAIER